MGQGTSGYTGKKALTIISNGAGGQVCCKFANFQNLQLLSEGVMITFISRRSKYLSGKTVRVSEGTTVLTQGSEPLRALWLECDFPTTPKQCYLLVVGCFSSNCPLPPTVWNECRLDQDAKGWTHPLGRQVNRELKNGCCS